MRYLILSDVHANLEALRAVLAHAARKSRDAVLFLGDAVGYGGAPNQVLELLRGLKGRVVSVRGNHDRVTLDASQGVVFFNYHARRAVEWAAGVLTPANRAFLKRLPQGPLDLGDGVAICHGSPADEDEYLLTEMEALEGFRATRAFVTFFGHSHVPWVFELGTDGERLSLAGYPLRGTRITVDLHPDRQYLINPGSVGQPRDRDPRASYAVYDSRLRRLSLYRVPYDVAGARRRIMAAGLPQVLADRLLHGA